MLIEVRVEKVLEQPEQMERTDQSRADLQSRVWLEKQDTEEESLKWGRGGEPILPRAPGCGQQAATAGNGSV